MREADLHSHPNGLTPSRGVWAGLAVVVGLVSAGVVAKGWSVAWADLALGAALGGLFLGLALVYTRWRPAPAIAATCGAVAFLVFSTSALATLSYLGVSIARPLMDAQFAGLDAALGFDWTAHLAAVAARPWLAWALTGAYFSCQAQFMVVILGLAWFDRKALGEFMTLYAITAVVVVGISVLLPAAGAYVHHAPDPALLAGLPDAAAGRWHLRDFTALRSGAFHRLSLHAVEGLVTFPSFHTALGVLFARAIWRVPYLGVAGVILNGAMILSTLAIGGHYLVDVLAGGAIALAAIAALKAAPALRRARRPAGEAAAEPVGAARPA